MLVLYNTVAPELRVPSVGSCSLVLAKNEPVLNLHTHKKYVHHQLSYVVYLDHQHHTVTSLEVFIPCESNSVADESAMKAYDSLVILMFL